MLVILISIVAYIIYYEICVEGRDEDTDVRKML